jgi:hypothetical protein
VERAIRSLPVEAAEEVGQETVRILKVSNKPRDNLSGAERALRSLRTNADLTVIHADKGNATVVLNTMDYNEKISALLRAPTYRRLAKDPTNAVERKTNLLLRKSSFSEVIQKLWPQGCRPPRLYGLPKIHKNGVPLRSIVSTIGAPTYRLAQPLAVCLELGDSPHHVRNSMDFIDTIRTLRTGPRDILVSFHIVSVFTMVPIGEALRLLSRHFDEAILRLFRHVLTSSFFSFNGQFYEQTDGVAMGSPLSPVIANYFMEYFEEMALESATYKPLCWFRYVDGTFVIWPHGPGKLAEFLDHLNGLHENIKFTIETEKDGHLPFLDIDI